MDKKEYRERLEKYLKIIERAEEDDLYKGNRQSLLMDIESADRKFNLRLDDWLKADEFNFAHDLYGIINNIVRDDFPATNFDISFLDLQEKRGKNMKKNKPRWKELDMWERLARRCKQSGCSEDTVEHIREHGRQRREKKCGT